MQIEAHDPHHQIEADLQDKGLSHDSVGLLGGTVLGISSVAPAYALTATIGILVAEAGAKMPVIIIAGFLPMFFAAYAYRELNKVAPDCGTSFTWTTKAFGPYVGWLGGWAAVLATVIVLSNLAGVAVQFFYQFIGDLTNNESIGALWENKLINVVTCLVFLAIATAVSYRGITTTEHVQFILVGFQMVVLVLFAVMALAKSGSSETGMSFSLDWFSPAGLTMSAFIAGLSGSIFAFWGWDTALTVNEESKDSEKTPGRAALLCVAVDPADLPAGGGRDPDVRRSGHRGAGSGQRGDLRQRVRRARRTGDGQPAEPVAVPGRGGLQRRQPDHHLPADLADHAGDGHLQGLPGALRHHPPPLPDTVLRVDRGRHRLGVVLLDPHLHQRERAHRHHLLAGHHDLLLLRADRVRLHLVLPPRTVRQRPELRVQAAVPAAGRARSARGLPDHASRQRLTRLRQRRQHRRRRAGPDPGSRD